jgi:outer membrane protein OmpA-like peptidoglycan-associated protein
MRTYRRLSVLAGLALAVAGAPPADAQQQRRYLVELGAAGFYQSFADVAALGGGTGGVLRAGVWLPGNFSLEGEGSILSSKPNVGQENIKVKALTVAALYNIPIGRASFFYLKAGGGGTQYASDCPPPSQAPRPYPCGQSSALLFGAGARAGVSPTVMLRGEALINRNSGQTRSFSNVGLNLGISLMLGSRPIADSDGDGILDNRDRCTDTPSGAQVDGRGCPADGDADGVPNGVDRCPTTVAGATVDSAGCPRDSDSDNIPDGLDRCPETQAGVLVDPRGCPRDSDGDAIPDGLDRCSETPRGATVDALGCPGDEDGDGVLDGLDRCPRSSAAARVNPAGCAPGQNPAPANPAVEQPPPAQQPVQQPAPQRDTTAVPAPDPTREQPAPRPAGGRPARLTPGVLHGVQFAPGTARLASGSYVVLDSLVEILLADPSARIEVAAHTDNSGTAGANLHLTTLQAEAVRNYLVTKGVPFQQVAARGYGATVPLTPDTTPRGRAANRRVEIRPVAAGP